MLQRLSLQGCSLPSKSNQLSLLGCASGESLLTCAGPQHGPQSQWSSRSAQSTCRARPCFDAAGPAPCASASPWGHSSGSSWRQMAAGLRVLPRARQVCCCLEPGPRRRAKDDCAAGRSSRGKTGWDINRRCLQSCGVGRGPGRGDTAVCSITRAASTQHPVPSAGGEQQAGDQAAVCGSDCRWREWWALAIAQEQTLPLSPAEMPCCPSNLVGRASPVQLSSATAPCPPEKPPHCMVSRPP